MFAKLTGRIDTIQLDGYLILDVNGVGYLLRTSKRTQDLIGRVGDKAGLLIETVVREDQISLYGFADQLEKQWFNILCGVQGVGAKAALAILAVISPEDLAMIISAQDKAMLTRADGVGPKLALRIVTELKDKAEKMGAGGHTPVSISIGTSNNKTSSKTKASTPDGARVNVNGDAISALVNLGYGRAESFAAVTQISRSLNDDDAQDLQVVIRESLKELGLAG